MFFCAKIVFKISFAIFSLFLFDRFMFRRTKIIFKCLFAVFSFFSLTSSCLSVPKILLLYSLIFCLLLSYFSVFFILSNILFFRNLSECLNSFFFRAVNLRRVGHFSLFVLPFWDVRNYQTFFNFKI